MNISPRYTDKHWKAAFAVAEDWTYAINIVEDRIRGRWLNAADRLLSEPYSGFAILALDCIVLESLWGFMNGEAVARGKEQQVYREMLTGPKFAWTDALSEDFLVRNGVIHDAETRRGWLIGKTVPSSVMRQPEKHGGYKLNRTKFHHAVKVTFEDWVAKLRAGDADLRSKMRRRMNQIISKHFAVNLPHGPLNKSISQNKGDTKCQQRHRRSHQTTSNAI
jgi:hypothetical protein